MKNNNDKELFYLITDDFKEDFDRYKRMQERLAKINSMVQISAGLVQNTEIVVDEQSVTEMVDNNTRIMDEINEIVMDLVEVEGSIFEKLKNSVIDTNAQKH